MTSAIGQASSRVAAEQDRLLAAQPLPDSDDILAGIGRRRRRAQNRARAIAALGATLALLLAIAIGTSFPRTKVVAVAAAHQPALGMTHAVSANVPLSFVDGTTIVVTNGATADLREVSEHGAVVALREGTLAVDVVHTDMSRWQINAGPFGIRVTGTKFDATWDAAEKRLTVAMSEGTVVVSGPCVTESLSAPNRRVFTCPESTVPVVEAASASAVVAAPVALPDLAGPSASAPPQPASSERIKESATSLFADADKARLAGDSPRARQLYLAVRERFPGTDSAGKSAFLLGRMADAAGGTDEAVRWFELASRERGGLASEAVGRLMELEQKRGNTDRARALAVEYLKKYPSGPHVAYASSIAQP